VIGDSVTQTTVTMVMFVFPEWSGLAYGYNIKTLFNYVHLCETVINCMSEYH